MMYYDNLMMMMTGVKHQRWHLRRWLFAASASTLLVISHPCLAGQATLLPGCQQDDPFDDEDNFDDDGEDHNFDNFECDDSGAGYYDYLSQPFLAEQASKKYTNTKGEIQIETWKEIQIEMWEEIEIKMW